MFRPYVFGSHFTVETDHQSLEWLIKASQPARLVRLALALSEYEFTIKYRRGRLNQNADALSRSTCPEASTNEEDRFEEVLVLDTLHIEFDNSELMYSQRSDPTFQEVIMECNNENGNVFKCGQFIIKDEILYRRTNDGKELIMIPDNLVEKLLKFYHNGQSLVHLHHTRLYALLSNRFYWNTIYKDVVDWTDACLQCKRHKTNQPKSHGLLEPILTSKPFELVEIDLKGPYKLTPRGYKYIFVCVDHFSNWVEAAPLKTITAKEIITVFFNLIISRHGCPKRILSDQGTQFISQAFKELCSHYNIEKIETTAYHQQCNGKVEKFGKFLLDTISTVLKADQSNWDQLIDSALFTYRVSLSRTLEDNPFFLLYGRDTVMPQDLFLPSTEKNLRVIQDEDIDEYKQKQLECLKTAYNKLYVRVMCLIDASPQNNRPSGRYNLVSLHSFAHFQKKKVNNNLNKCNSKLAIKLYFAISFKTLYFLSK